MIENFETRRSIYSIGRKEVLKKEEISSIIEHCLKFCPTAFNSQSARLVVLYDDASLKFWQIALNELKKLVPADKFAQTEEKITSFSAGIGTILFFEDTETIENLQSKYALYKDNFPKWAEQANAMLQYMIWTSLSSVGIGSNLQHYNPLVDKGVQDAWDISPKWKLIAQMPFGSIEAPADEKSFLPIEGRLKVFS